MANQRSVDTDTVASPTAVYLVYHHQILPAYVLVRAGGISATTPQADATAEGDARGASRLVLLFYLSYDAPSSCSFSHDHPLADAALSSCSLLLFQPLEGVWTKFSVLPRLQSPSPSCVRERVKRERELVKREGERVKFHVLDFVCPLPSDPGGKREKLPCPSARS